MSDKQPTRELTGTSFQFSKARLFWNPFTRTVFSRPDNEAGKTTRAVSGHRRHGLYKQPAVFESKGREMVSNVLPRLCSSRQPGTVFSSSGGRAAIAVTLVFLPGDRVQARPAAREVLRTDGGGASVRSQPLLRKALLGMSHLALWGEDPRASPEQPMLACRGQEDPQHHSSL